MIAELTIRYCGKGYNCSNCGRNREATSYVLSLEGKVLQQFMLCDGCQDQGYTIRFTPKKPPIYHISEKRRRIKLSRRLEEGLARDVGGHTQPGSGNQDAKGDVRVVNEWRLEHKFTDSKSSYTLKVEELAAVVRHANLAREWPGLIITFRQLARQFAIIPYELFLEIVEKTHGSHQD